MTSRLIVNSIRHTGASADAITLDNSGNATFPANVTCSGTASGFGGGKILQVVESTSSTTVTTSGGTEADLLTLSITPSSSSSKIMVICSMIIGGQDGSLYVYKLLRGSTDICVGDAASNRARATIFGQHSGSAYIGESDEATEF